MVSLQKDCDLKLLKDLVDDKNLSRIYGFILYTDADGIVASTLANESYWKSFDFISGLRWPIFTVRQLQKGYYKQMGGGSINSTGFMVSKWYEPPINMDVLKNFEIESTEELPCFIAFIWDDDDKIHSIRVNIEGNSEPEVYNRIKEIVSAISRAEEAVEPQYKRNVELFRNVETELNALKFRYKAKIVYKAVNVLKEFFGLFA